MLEWAGKTATFERAAASYLVALRNATHGHGGDKGTAEQRERDTTLLIQHNGDIPEDLSLLAYLYLLDTGRSGTSSQDPQPIRWMNHCPRTKR